MALRRAGIGNTSWVRVLSTAFAILAAVGNTLHLTPQGSEPITQDVRYELQTKLAR